MAVTFTATAFVVRIIVTFAAAAFMIRIIVTVPTTAFMLFLMGMTTTTTATTMFMTMTTSTPLSNTNSFELTTFKLGNGFFDDFGARAIDLNTLVEQIAQRHAVDAGAQHGVNRGAFLFCFFMHRNRGDGTGFGVENYQMAGVGEMRFGGRLQAVGFLDRDTEFHGISSGLD